MITACELALISSDVYFPFSTPFCLDLSSLGWQKHDLPDEIYAIYATGFYGRIYYNKAYNEVVVAYRGTVEQANWKENFNIVVRKIKGEYYQNSISLMNLGYEVGKKELSSNFHLTLTGHSLGGMLAKILAANNRAVRAIAFDSPGIGDVEGIPVSIINPSYIKKHACDHPVMSEIIVDSECEDLPENPAATLSIEYPNLQSVLVKKSIVNRLGKHVGHIHWITLSTPSCDALDALQKRGHRRASFAETANTLAPCLAELHEIKRIATALKTQNVVIKATYGLI